MSNIPGAFAKREKCPCCNNPWNQEDSSASTYIACTPCLEDAKGYKGIDPSNFDNSLSPGENFFLWSNGGWKAKNPIPAEYSSWNTFIVLRDLNIERLKNLLDELGNEDNANSNNEEHKKLKDFYSAFMNEVAINDSGIQSIRQALQLCDDIHSNPTNVIAQLHSVFGINVFFSLYSSPDKQDSNHSIASLHQSGLGLPDRDYYFDADKQDKRDKYVEYIRDMFQLLGNEVGYEAYRDAEYALQVAKEILQVETQLATWHLTRTMCRDPKITYNKMSLDGLIRLMQSNYAVSSYAQYLTQGVTALPFHWDDYFALIGKPRSSLGDINVASKEILSKFMNVFNQFKYAAEGSRTTRSAVTHYALFHVLNNFAPHLTTAFVNRHFAFHEKELKGTQEILPRWKRALQNLESALGDALGKLYVTKYFTSDMKAKALEVVQNVKNALRERIQEVPWMKAETKEQALLKMEKFKVKIGYPNSWKDYSSLQITQANHVTNVIASRQFEFAIELGRINAPTDKARWFMTPQTVNAYYHPSLNEIVFPAAILQPPFFDNEADVAVQYGSLGAVVGHEMTHGFDDQGRKYDHLGNLRDWWTQEDGEEYEKRAKVMIQQAEKFEVHGNKLNGKLTCGENIADLGGVKLALRALKTHLQSNEAPLINGLSAYQRFFLAWSQSWRENVKKERAIQLVTIDPHGPNELRCNGTLRNIAEFYEAFSITNSDPMYLAEEERVDVW